MRNNFIILITILFLFSCSDIFDEEAVYGCIDKSACNYNENATLNWEGSCEYPIGTCDCDNLPIDQYCDCDGNIDSDFDGFCDDIDICVGEYSDGYYCDDLHVLEDFITYNPGSYLDTISISEILNSNCLINEYGRLKYLSLSNKNLYVVPSSIANLDFLETLYLNDNNIADLDSSICDINDNCEIFIQNNRLCDDDYLDCIDHWGDQECDE